MRESLFAKYEKRIADLEKEVKIWERRDAERNQMMGLLEDEYTDFAYKVQANKDWNSRLKIRVPWIVRFLFGKYET